MAVETLEIDHDAGQRIDNFLLRTLSGVPRSRIYRLLRKGEVRVNGKRTKPEYRLEAGDRVRIPPVRRDEADAQRRLPAPVLAALQTSVIHQDDRIIVLNKASGLAVHGGSGVDFGVIEGMRALFGKRMELAHRIDRDTSGCLVLARTRPALVALHEAFRTGSVSKRYDFLTYGRWPAKARTARQRLKRYVTRSGERRVRVDLGGKPSRTDFEVQQVDHGKSWVVARPHTGRTHQIRVHCLAWDHPIIGDEKYADDRLLERARGEGVQRLCLHASALSFVLDGKKMKFVAPIPPDFEQAWGSEKKPELNL